MSAPFSNEDAEVRVGVIVRPLRGHWRPVGSQPQIHLDDIRNTLDPSVWKTAHDFDNEAKMLFTSKMVYSNHKLNEGDGAAAEVEVQKHSHPPMAPISKIKDREKSSADSVLVSRCPSSCKCGASSTAVTLNSPPPESNRIKVPPNLDEEKDLWKEM
ncbi:hypothetical protein Y032_0367g28 [Ancylostoma ceylanicum]|uniref:Uncharacterized protein n=1 Tax=Ancylostoma ceylanicum TaxID=53326 RepID=A0A016RUN8_9BILA|nr:hypothetical protein Y032_0367g28 [Ancylostoma ceylanicum]